MEVDLQANVLAAEAELIEEFGILLWQENVLRHGVRRGLVQQLIGDRRCDQV